MDDLERPSSPYLNVRLRATKTETLAAFSVCQESRQVALSTGYRLWTTDSDASLYRVKDIMWNPKLDTIFLPRQLSLEESPLSMLLDLCPVEARSVEKLAVDSSIDHCEPPEDYLLPHVKPLVALKELVLLLGEDDTKYFMVRQGRDWINKADTDALAERCLVDFRKLMLHRFNASVEWKDWKPPVVRVAWSEDLIMDGR